MNTFRGSRGLLTRHYGRGQSTTLYWIAQFWKLQGKVFQMENMNIDCQVPEAGNRIRYSGFSLVHHRRSRKGQESHTHYSCRTTLTSEL